MIDFKKYGFVKIRDYKDKKHFDNEQDGVYEKKLDGLFTLKLHVFARSITLDMVANENTENEHKMTLAERYECYTQKQFDFLMLNGRAAGYFMQEGMKPLEE